MKSLSSHLTVRFFGPFSVKKEDGTDVRWAKREAAKWLLALLLLRRSELSYDWLQEQLWPTLDVANVNDKNRLVRGVIKALKDTLGKAYFVDAPKGVLSLKAEMFKDVDLYTFDALTQRGDYKSLEEAMALYTGEFLEDCSYEWAKAPREDHKQIFKQVISKLIEEAESNAAYDEAEKYIRFAIAHNSRYKDSNEDYWRQLISLLIKQEKHDQALAYWNTYAAETSTHRISATMMRLHEHIHENLALSLSSPITLPPEESAFYGFSFSLAPIIGRESDINRYFARLSAGQRWINLKGISGIGKTELAIQVVRIYVRTTGALAGYLEISDQLPRVPPEQSLAEVFQLPRPIDPWEDLIAFLQPRDVILLIDTQERLPQKYSIRLKELLNLCPRLKIVSTSYSSLGLSYVDDFRVSPLALPPKQDIEHPKDMASYVRDYSAIELFLDRMPLSPDPSEEDILLVAKICQRLSGIPLALILAASGARELPLTRVAAEIEGTWQAKKRDDPSLPERHRSLRTALDWSIRLIPETKTLLYQLSIFVGDWTQEAAEAICEIPRTQSPSIRDLLDILRDHSLVVFQNNARFRLLDAIQQYGQLHLKESGNMTILYSRHFDYFLQFAQEAKDRLAITDVKMYLQRLASEHENIRSAWIWTTQRNEDYKGYLLARSLSRFWDISGYFAEGRQWMEHLLRKDSSLRPEEQATLLNTLAGITHNQGDFAVAKAYYQRMLKLAKKARNNEMLANAYRGLAYEAFTLGDYILARHDYLRCLDLWTHSPDIQEPTRSAGISQTSCNIGTLEIRVGNYEDARRYLTNSLQISDNLRDERGRFFALYNLADLEMFVGNFPQSVYYCELALDATKPGDRQNWAYLKNLLGALARLQHRFADARNKHKQSMEVLEELEDKQGIAIAHFYLGLLDFEEGNLEDAARHFVKSITLREQTGIKRGIVECIEAIALLCNKENRYAEAVTLLEIADRLRIEISAPIPPFERSRVQNLRESLLDTLDQPAFQAAHQNGIELSQSISRSVNYARYATRVWLSE